MPAMAPTSGPPLACVRSFRVRKSQRPQAIGVSSNSRTRVARRAPDHTHLPRDGIELRESPLGRQALGALVALFEFIKGLPPGVDVAAVDADVLRRLRIRPQPRSPPPTDARARVAQAPPAARWSKAPQPRGRSCSRRQAGPRTHGRAAARRCIRHPRRHCHRHPLRVVASRALAGVAGQGPRTLRPLSAFVSPNPPPNLLVILKFLVRQAPSSRWCCDGRHGGCRGGGRGGDAPSVRWCARSRSRGAKAGTEVAS